MISAYLALSLLFSTVLADDAFSQVVPFDIQKVAAKAQELPSHSWEYGTAVEALFELYNPELSVYGDKPFPAPTPKTEDIKALSYAKDKIVIGEGANSLSDGDGAVGDPASLGVAAYLIGKSDEKYANATQSQLDYVVNDAPRWENGAISQRADVAELWSDFVYMAPPFIAYVGADTGNKTLLEESLKQIETYHEVLVGAMRNTTPVHNAWQHIIGPQSADPYLWGTGNGWAANGMARVLATIQKAPAADDTLKTRALNIITGYMKEILDSVLTAKLDNGLLRNYIDDYDSAHGFGEFAGMTSIAGATFRMAILSPDTFNRNSEYIRWAKSVLTILGEKDKNGTAYVTDEGIVRPTVNPLGWTDVIPFEDGSPEAQGFVTLAYAAFRDCVKAEKCDSNLESPTVQLAVDGAAAAASISARSPSRIMRNFNKDLLSWSSRRFTVASPA